ncbi:PREDICTED: zinc finger protein 184-like isoform X2 [Vollenhovia emeryi]|uniref:zinc finger protein 184-like isoform X2 n=1 Tax=Vollenhovia emeryi TaxID=411798 RepID=UPI0005F45A11|nr:PREDICTED: zinc finger protein 184-like isoform X2 [Vollenhovia emeryi]
MDSPGDEAPREPAKCPSVLPQFSELCTSAAAFAAIDMETFTRIHFPSRPTLLPATECLKMGGYSLQDLLPAICKDKQAFNQIINVPNYVQNNGTLGVQSSGVNFINSLCIPSTSQADTGKQESSVQKRKRKSRVKFNMTKESGNLMKRLTPATMAEYVQKQSFSDLQLQEAMRDVLGAEPSRKTQDRQEEKAEQAQNILNIPNIRNFLQNSNNFASADQITVAINPNDLNLPTDHEIENSMRNVLKVEQQVQTDLPKTGKKLKFRAKLGEIKISFNYDGTQVFCCPECNFGHPDRAHIEQHIQIHVQERKYQCRECGAMLKRKEHLDQHMRGHSDERPFKCDVCHKGFKRNEHLTRHTVIHSGNKDFRCKLCQKAFSRKDHLNKHFQTHMSTRKKMKDESCYIDQNAAKIFENSDGAIVAPKQEANYFLKDSSLLKQEALLQHMQNPKNFLHTFASLKDHMMKDINMSEQAQTSNMDENLRYIMPS